MPEQKDMNLLALDDPLNDRLSAEVAVRSEPGEVLAAVLVHDPPVLLLDEPFNAIDAKTSADLLALVQRWHGEGRTEAGIEQPNFEALLRSRVVHEHREQFVLGRCEMDFRLANEDLARLEYNHEWYRDAPWSSFDPSALKASGPTGVSSGSLNRTVPAGRGQNLDRGGGRGPRLLRQRAGGKGRERTVRRRAC